MLEYTNLEEIWFVVTPHNPHKNKTSLLDDHTRLRMVQLALEEQYKLRASNMEFALPQPSYTATSLAHAVEKFPGKEFALIMGADNLASFKRWRNWEWIIDHHELYVYPRLESDGGELRNHPRVHCTEAPIMQIASTDIRQAIAAQKEVSFMLPPAVWRFIDENLYYRS